MSTWSLKEYTACEGSIFPYTGGCSFGHSFPGRKQMKRQRVRKPRRNESKGPGTEESRPEMRWKQQGCVSRRRVLKAGVSHFLVLFAGKVKESAKQLQEPSETGLCLTARGSSPPGLHSCLCLSWLNEQGFPIPILKFVPCHFFHSQGDCSLTFFPRHQGAMVGCFCFSSEGWS